ncbi:MAG: hypothetical protein IJ426_06525 [Clostridia bacterium]|nr:hypothetical protein [Clostridia bacterium]
MNNTAVINNPEIATEQTIVTEAPKKADANAVLKKILAARYFVPIASTVGFLFCLIGSNVFTLIGALLIFVGLVTALTVCPLKLVSFPIKCAAVGFKICRGFIPVYGVADLVAAIVGTTLGIMFGMVVSACFPAFFTLRKYLASEEEAN